MPQKDSAEDTMEVSKCLFIHLFVAIFTAKMHKSHCENMTIPFHVGVILDMDMLVGQMGWTSISMAIEDFYSINGDYRTRVVLHARDSNDDVVQATDAGRHAQLFVFCQ